MRRPAAASSQPWLLKWWPALALGLSLIGGGVGAWYDLRQRVAVSEATTHAAIESLSNRIEWLANERGK